MLLNRPSNVITRTVWASLSSYEMGMRHIKSPRQQLAKVKRCCKSTAKYYQTRSTCQLANKYQIMETKPRSQISNIEKHLTSYSVSSSHGLQTFKYTGNEYLMNRQQKA
uniref:Uncharacterized protein n=1 Tax=Sphaerodactylus townsendi TaxID=933632 RepID=A0ACB8G7D6_9SAUR